MVVRTRSCSGTIGLNLNRVKLHKGAPLRRRPGDPETLKLARAPFAPDQLRARGLDPWPRPPSQLRSPFCVLFSPRHRTAEEPYRPTRTYIQTLPDTAGSKRIKEIRNDMKKIS